MVTKLIERIVVLGLFWFAKMWLKIQLQKLNQGGSMKITCSVKGLVMASNVIMPAEGRNKDGEKMVFTADGTQTQLLHNFEIAESTQIIEADVQEVKTFCDYSLDRLAEGYKFAGPVLEKVGDKFNEYAHMLVDMEKQKTLASAEALQIDKENKHLHREHEIDVLRLRYEHEKEIETMRQASK